MQRDVVWESKHVIALWNDIEQHINSSLMTEMFLGVIITHSAPQLPSLNPNKAGLTVPMPTYKEMTEGLKSGSPSYFKKDNFVRWAQSLGVENSSTLGDLALCAAIDAKREPSRVIDGQQRITTICIGAKILSEICKRKNLNTLATALDKIYQTKSSEPRIYHRDGNDRRDFLNIIKNHTDKSQLVSGWAPRSEKDPALIRNIYEITLKHVWMRVRRSKKRLTALAEWFLSNIRVVYLETTQESQEHLIFKAINDAGERLVASQKFKSILYHQIAMNTRLKGEKLIQTDLHNKWEDIEKIISPYRDPKSVTSFLKAYCRSIGIQSDGNKTLKNEDVLAGLIEVLNTYTKKKNPLSQIQKFVDDVYLTAKNYNQLCNPSSKLKVIEDIKKDEGKQKTWDRWQDIVDLNGIYSSRGLIPLLLAIRKLKDTRKQNKCIKYILLITLFSVIPKVIRVKPSKLAGDYSTEWIELIRHGQINDFKLDVQNKIVNDANQTYTGSLGKYTTASDDAKSSGKTPAAQRSAGVQAQCKYIQKKWIDLMKSQRFEQGDVKQIKFILRKVESLSAKGTASSWLTQYDTMEINAEHIFPKTTPWRGKRSSTWKKEHDLFPNLWPIDEGDRNRLKWKLGNFILLEAGLNKGCGNKTWKGWNDSKGATDGKPHLGFTTAPTVKLSKKHGKIHWYKFKKWEHQGKEYTGSQLIAVNKFIDKHETEDYWSEQLLEQRTSDLLEKAMDEKQVQEFKLSILFN